MVLWRTSSKNVQLWQPTTMAQYLKRHWGRQCWNFRGVPVNAATLPEYSTVVRENSDSFCKYCSQQVCDSAHYAFNRIGVSTFWMRIIHSKAVLNEIRNYKASLPPILQLFPHKMKLENYQKTNLTFPSKSIKDIVEDCFELPTTADWGMREPYTSKITSFFVSARIPHLL